MPAPYFKQILIPFGEYMPFASVFPWLNRLNEHAGLFSWGKEIKVFAYPIERLDGSNYTARISPLICYEDTVTGPARDATRQGAELLVNLTYDTWFGRSAAPYQHHLIAIFRAIENRRLPGSLDLYGLHGRRQPAGQDHCRNPGVRGRQARGRCYAHELSEQLHELRRRNALVGPVRFERGEHHCGAAENSEAGHLTGDRPTGPSPNTMACLILARAGIWNPNPKIPIETCTGVER